MNHYQLEVYTSAPELLDSAGSNLGVIARTRGYPSELTRELSSYRYYTFLDELPMDDPSVHPPRVVMGPVGNSDYYAITHSAFLGSDFTGRTTPTVHHAVLKSRELLASSCSIADFLWSLQHSRSRLAFAQPTWIEDLPQVASQISEGAFKFHASVFQDLNTRDDLLCFIADCIIRYAITGRAVILVLDPAFARDALVILADIFSLLPKTVQLRAACHTHNLSASDFARGSCFGITYRDTEFHRQVLQRHDPKRPFIVDPGNTSSFTADGDTTFVEILRKALEQGKEAVAQLLEMYDASGTTAETLGSFCRFWEAQRALASVQSVSDVLDVNSILGRMSSLSTFATSAIEAAGQSCVVSASAGTDNVAVLSQIVKSEHWPLSTRQSALNELRPALGDAIPVILSGQAGAEPSVETITFVGQQLGHSNGARHWLVVAKRFLSANTLQGISLSRHLLNAASVPLSQLLKWRMDLAGKQTQVADRLLADVNEQVRKVLDSELASSSVTACMQDPKCHAQLTHVLQTAAQLPPPKTKQIVSQLLQEALKLDHEPLVTELVRHASRLGEQVLDNAFVQESTRLAAGTKYEPLFRSEFIRLAPEPNPTPTPKAEPYSIAPAEPLLNYGGAPVRRSQQSFKLKGRTDNLRRFTPDGLMVAIFSVTVSAAFVVAYYLKHQWQITGRTECWLLVSMPLAVGMVSLVSLFITSRNPDGSPVHNFVVQVGATTILLLAMIIALLSILISKEILPPIYLMGPIFKLFMLGMN